MYYLHLLLKFNGKTQSSVQNGWRNTTHFSKRKFCIKILSKDSLAVNKIAF